MLGAEVKPQPRDDGDERDTRGLQPPMWAFAGFAAAFLTLLQVLKACVPSVVRSDGAPDDLHSAYCVATACFGCCFTLSALNLALSGWRFRFQRSLQCCIVLIHGRSSQSFTSSST